MTPDSDTAVGARHARAARADLGLPRDGPLPCVLRAVEETAGIPVVFARLGERVAGACWGAGTASPLVAVNQADPAVRQRFTLAHEFGHVCCGHVGMLPKDTADTLRGRSRDPRETQANAFAAEFLMPESGVRRVLGYEPSLDELVVLAAGFGVSTLAAVVRVRTLGLLGDRAHDAIRVRMRTGEHGEIWDRHGCREIADAVGAHRNSGAPHRFSPALRGGALAMVLSGEASVEVAAARAGLDPAALRTLVQALAAD